MKHIGIVAVSTEGAALCYRTLCLEGAEVLGQYAHPEISLHNFPLSAYQLRIDRNEWDKVGEMLLESATKLLKAGAQFLICPDNTIHQGLDLVRDRSPAPWIHIAEEVTREAEHRGFKRVGILGTRFLMEGPVYPSQLTPAGIEYRIPNAGQRERINQIIYDELWCARDFCEHRANTFKRSFAIWRATAATRSRWPAPRFHCSSARQTPPYQSSTPPASSPAPLCGWRPSRLPALELLVAV